MFYFLTRSEHRPIWDPRCNSKLEFHENNDINTLENRDKLESDTSLLFFISGSRGFPVGTFKTQTNLSQEVEALKEFVSSKSIKRVVVTVPFL